jgi:nucleoside-diphosphate-sugar epimerase
MIGDGQNLRHCLYIEDLIDAFDRCATRDEAIGQTFIIGDETAVTMRYLIEEIAAVMKVPPPGFKVPVSLMAPLCTVSEVFYRVAGKEPPFSKRSLKFFTNNTSFDISKAKKLLRYVPRVPLKEGLRLTYDDLRWHGQIR